ncbi:unnamed protein product [Phyllotreta striolata]|uniref:Uncharacterized protein n=1 Tax=Phyllotreta striolata TaxID=444603 RepID=A0A9N9XSW7_PHYSR|nr:unnamed protein product [Phyllotreta striolata]
MKIRFKYFMSSLPKSSINLPPEVESRRFDIYASFIPQKLSSIRFFQFSSPILDDHSVLVVPNIEAYDYFKLFYAEFYTKVWCAIIVVLITVYLVFYAIIYLLPSRNFSVLMLILSVIFEGVTSVRNANRSFRILLLNYLLFGLIITNVYKSKMFDLLRRDFHYELVKNEEDIMKNRLKFGINSIQVLHNLETWFPPTVNLTAENLVFFCKHYDECVNRTLYEKDVVTISLIRSIHYDFFTVFEDANKKPMAHFIPTQSTQVYVPVYFLKGHPLYQKINRKLSVAKASGFAEFIYQKYSRAYKKIVGLRKDKISKTSQLTMNSLKSTFGLYLVFYLVFVAIINLLPSKNFSVLMLILSVIFEGVTSVRNASRSFRILLVNYLLFGLIITNVYKSKMFDVMRSDFSYETLNNRDDIMKNKLKIGVNSLQVLRSYEYWFSSHTNLTEENLAYICKEYNDCINRTLNRKDVVTISLVRILKHDFSIFLDENKNPLVHFLPSMSMQSFMPIYFLKGHPLFHKVNKKLFIAKESGFIDNLYKKYSRNFDKIAELRKDKISKTSQLTMNSLKSTFGLYLVCLNQIEQKILDDIKRYFVRKVVFVITTNDTPEFSNKHYTVVLLNDCLVNSYLNIFNGTYIENTNELKLMYTATRPYSMNSQKGIIVELLNLVLTNMKIRFAYNLSDLPENSINLPADVRLRLYDIYASFIPLEYGNTRFFEFTVPVLDDESVYVSPNIDTYDHFKLFYAEFKPNVWGVTIAVFITVYLVFNAIIHLLPIENFSVLMLILSVIFEGITSVRNRSKSFKILLASYLLFALIMTNVYKSKMFDEMRSDFGSELVKSSEDILKNRLKVGTSSLRVLKNFENVFSPYVNFTAENLVYMCPKYDDCINRTLTTKDVVTISLSRIVKYDFSKVFIDEDKNPLAHFVLTRSFPSYMPIYFLKGHPLFHKVNRKLIIAKESGLIESIYKKYSREYDKIIGLRKDNISKTLVIMINFFLENLRIVETKMELLKLDLIKAIRRGTYSERFVATFKTSYKISYQHIEALNVIFGEYYTFIVIVLYLKALENMILITMQAVTQTGYGFMENIVFSSSLIYDVVKACVNPDRIMGTRCKDDIVMNFCYNLGKLYMHPLTKRKSAFNSVQIVLFGIYTVIALVYNSFRVSDSLSMNTPGPNKFIMSLLYSQAMLTHVCYFYGLVTRRRNWNAMSKKLAIVTNLLGCNDISRTTAFFRIGRVILMLILINLSIVNIYLVNIAFSSERIPKAADNLIKTCYLLHPDAHDRYLTKELTDLSVFMKELFPEISMAGWALLCRDGSDDTSLSSASIQSLS